MFTRTLALLAVVAFIGLAPITAHAQENDGAEEDVQGDVPDDAGPAYYSNNPCQSGFMPDGSPVNCNNALGVEVQQRVIVIQPQRIYIQQRHPHLIQVWQRCPGGMRLVTMWVN